MSTRYLQKSQIRKLIFSFGDNYFKKIIEEYEKNGIEVIFFIHPGVSSEKILDLHYSFHKSRPDDKIIDLTDPKKYEHLYNPEIYFDEAHMLKHGSYLLTKEIIKEFLAIEKVKELN
jgi:hypothetical protein